MGRLLCVVLLLLALAPCGADELEASSLRMTIGANEYLVAGSELVRAGQFDEGIRLTLVGLERGNTSVRDRAAGLANLCAAYVSKNEPDAALPYCDRSLELDESNWRVYTARARAYFLKRKFAEAKRDNDAAAAINPDSVHVQELGGKLNEQLLQPRVITEDHQPQPPAR